jgi:hypothetical protein
VTKWYIYRKRGVLALSGDTLVVLMFLEEGIVHAIEPFGYLQSIHLNKDAQDAISESIEYTY